ncbi:hypothetical protein [Pseudoalteromonas denitrificans]|uniref:Holin of 3TMs, for gene-transfer release n=1 Tax=Pseudoalteromonas denitrificans DSM 6059 TaxID=1123010 RepID=A0A1I1G6N9_9GAMM|nr:hypothetical protein [Pseudoalteromonas denitrificans]SFC07205.1 hypothetical protein SAMN02745724_00835 [Pseudoalteromonas denitrificans DSM 6059]
MWLQALMSLGGLVKEVISGHQKIKQAKTIAKINRINDWENSQADAAKTSWKDEWFTVLLSIPFAMCFIPEFAQYAHMGFEHLSQTPDWYRWMFGLAVGASFGVRIGNQFIK